ncbi:hypothetical protein EV361DRAFT_364752 [Lentinula raphanica]|nr:hypothetical protein EV361DRAFT_364752 [Lentinula raphanica]
MLRLATLGVLDSLGLIRAIKLHPAVPRISPYLNNDLSTSTKGILIGQRRRANSTKAVDCSTLSTVYQGCPGVGKRFEVQTHHCTQVHTGVGHG